MVLLTVCDARKPVNLISSVTGKMAIDKCSFIYDFYNVTETEIVTPSPARSRREDDKDLTWDKKGMVEALIYKKSFFSGRKSNHPDEWYLKKYYSEIFEINDFLDMIRVCGGDIDIDFLADNITYYFSYINNYRYWNGKNISDEGLTEYKFKGSSNLGMNGGKTDINNILNKKGKLIISYKETSGFVWIGKNHNINIGNVLESKLPLKELFEKTRFVKYHKISFSNVGQEELLKRTYANLP